MVSNMSIWLMATVTLNPKHLDLNRNPIDGLKKIFKKNGKDFDEDYAEAEMTRKGDSVEIHICNPDCYVDCIHNSFNDIVKQCPFVQGIHISSNYYF